MFKIEFPWPVVNSKSPQPSDISTQLLHFPWLCTMRVSYHTLAPKIDTFSLLFEHVVVVRGKITIKQSKNTRLLTAANSMNSSPGSWAQDAKWA